MVSPENHLATGFSGLGLKTRSGLDEVKVWAEGTCHHPQAYFGGQREVEKEPCPSDASSTIWTEMPLSGMYLNFSIRASSLSVKPYLLYIEVDGWLGKVSLALSIPPCLV